MTIQPTEYILTDVFATAITYSLEILEEEEPREGQLELVSKFLQQAAKLNEALVKRNESEKLISEVSKVMF